MTARVNAFVDAGLQRAIVLFVVVVRPWCLILNVVSECGEVSKRARTGHVREPRGNAAAWLCSDRTHGDWSERTTSTRNVPGVSSGLRLVRRAVYVRGGEREVLRSE